ncbi:helix-turn-helix transcriptional regulator [Methyloceanibacter sp.]|uniref:helix-turn-helix domain-containing protein n=1 Tax=Methyloceanibacter sp. TaxID=1965321 RepID=UPI002D4BF529|nr:helix-turn-helix transcriptional regulator [Methyloceanibacter sp.]HZP10342.1 helix-turn-helix transcriptional regulator [Methyloceanibacter sp.]
MPIVVTLDLMLARRKMKAKDLAAFVGITESNLSLLRTGKVRGVRFETLMKICQALDCQPGDILTYVPGADGEQD